MLWKVRFLPEADFAPQRSAVASAGGGNDRYGKGRKVLMLFSAFTQFLENSMNAFNSYYFTTGRYYSKTRLSYQTI